MAILETVRICDGKGSYIVINKSDLKKEHKLYEEGKKVAKKKKKKK
jgi:hypothetical protein